MEINKYSSLNTDQTVAEKDSFTAERYLQFIRHFRLSTNTVLGYRVRNRKRRAWLSGKNARKTILRGLDVVEERIDKIRKDRIYDELYVATATQIPVKDNILMQLLLANL